MFDRDPNGRSYILKVGDPVKVIEGKHRGRFGKIVAINRKLTVRFTTTVFSVPPKFKIATAALHSHEVEPY